MSRLLRWAAIAAAVLIVLVTIALLLVNTRWAEEQARRQIVSRVTRALNGELTIGSLEGSLYGHITLRDVTLTQGGAPLLHADAIEVRYQIGRLWREGIVVDDVVVTRPVVSLVERDDGWNFARLVKARERTGKGPRVRLDRLRISDGDVSLTPKTGTARRFQAVALDSSLDLDDGNTAMQIASGAARDVAGVQIESLRTRFTFGQGQWAATEMQARTPLSIVSGRIGGTIADGLRGLDFDLTTDPVALADVQRYVAALGALPADMSVTTHATGAGGRVNAAPWRMTSSAGSATGTLAGEFAPEGFRGRGRLDATDVDLAQWLDDKRWASRLRASGEYELVAPAAGFAKGGYVRFDMRAPEVAILGYRAGAVTARGKYVDGELTADTTGVAYGARASAAVHWVRATRSMTLLGKYAAMDLRQLPANLAVPAMASDLAGAFELSYGPQGWAGSTTFDVSTLEGATIAAGATARFDARTSPIAYEFHGPVSGVNVSRVLSWLDQPPAILERLDEPINGTIDFAGTGTSLETLDATADVALTDSRVLGVGITAATVHSTIRNRALAATIDATVGDVSEKSIEYDALGPFDAKGTVRASVRLPDVTAPFSLDAVEAAATATLTGGRWRGLAIERGDVDASWAKGVIDVRTLDVTGPDFTAKASGRVIASGDAESNLKYDLTVANLAAIEDLVGRPIAGSASTTGTVTGTAKAPVAAGELRLQQLTVDQAKALAVNFTYRATMPDFDPKQATAHAEGTASMVAYGDRQVDEIKAVADYRAEEIDVDVTAIQGDRTVRVAGLIVPQPEENDLRLRRLDAAVGAARWSMPENGEAVIHYASDRVTVESLALVSGDARITVAGTFGRAGADALRVTAERVPIESFAQLMPEERNVTGILDGNATIAGPFDAPQIAVDANVVNGTVSNMKFEKVGGMARYADGKLILDASLLAGELGSLTAAGSMPLSIAGADVSAIPYDLTIRSQSVNLGFFGPVVPGLDKVGGTGLIDVKVGGPSSKPDLTGSIVLNEATFLVIPTGVVYQHVNADLVVKGQQVIVNKFTAQDDDGHLATITGELQVPGVGPPKGFDLKFTADDVHVLKNEYGEVSMSADLSFLGDLTTPLVSGTIEIDRALVEASDLLDRLSARGYQPLPGEERVEGGGEGTPDSTLSRSSLSITLAMPDNVVVRGQDLRSGSGPIGLGNVNVTVGGALTIAKDTGEPLRLTGRMDVVRGTYDFQGRRFDIRRGSELRFTGEPGNPGLNVDAERIISGVTANVHLGGTLAQPEIALSSNPPLDPGDVLSLIVFNQAMNQLQSDDKVNLAARAGLLAAGAVATPLADSVARALDLDMLEIRAPETTGGGASVIIGRQLNERLFVGFRHDFGADEVSQVSFEYRVNEFLRVVTSLAQGGGSVSGSQRTEAAGIDLIFIIR
ncbi:MAG TPA: translocation/assembly module TamB domain-containing protein [Vicinamibacterales bacterium]|nr:translocation/assembly module TamB domain-containing protein [Vicinamibacterales bacterium]